MSEFQDKVNRTLEVAQKVYQERNAVYKDNFRTVGRIMTSLFPDGAPELKTEEDFNRWHIFELIMVKLSRYVNNWDEGGHEDSLHDMIVYMGILSGLDAEWKEKARSITLHFDSHGTQLNVDPAPPADKDAVTRARLAQEHHIMMRDAL